MKKTDAGGLPASQLLALSLFVMLLAFFMVLNAISTFDEKKSRPIIQSIESTFGTETAKGGISPVKSPADVPQTVAMGQGQVFAQIKELFQAEIPSFTSKIFEDNDMMFVRMKEPEFRAAMGLDAQGPPNDFVKRLLAITAPKNSELRYEINVLAGVGDNPAYTATKGYARLENSVRLAGQYGERLVAAGLPPHLITAGLQRGRMGFIDIYFSRYLGPPAPPEAQFTPTERDIEDIEEKIAPLLQEQMP